MNLRKFLLPLLSMTIAFAFVSCETTTPLATEPDVTITPTDTVGASVNPTDTVVVTPTVTVAPDGLPVDPKPDQYTDFVRRNALLDHTGTQCQWCPKMHRELLTIEEGANSDKMIMVYSHTFNQNDPMYNATAEVFRKVNKTNTYPYGNIDFSSKQGFKYSLKASGIEAKALKLGEASPAMVNISATSALESDRKIKISVGIKVATTGEYGINVLFLEDGVKAKQTGAASMPDKDVVDYTIHNHALRGALVNDIEGKVIGKLEAGKVHKEEIELTVPSKIVDIKNCKLVIYITAQDPKSTVVEYSMNNIIRCPITGAVPFSYSK